MPSGFKILLSSLNEIRLSKEYFIDYLNSGSKEAWDNYVLYSAYHFGYANIVDKKLIPEPELEILSNLVDEFYLVDFFPDQRENHAVVLQLFEDTNLTVRSIIISLLDKDMC